MADSSIKKLVEGHDLSREEVRDLFGRMMDGALTDIEKAALLVALRMKGETPDEISGAAEAMRGRMTSLEIDPEGLVDTCGTGGDATGTVNISTIAAIIAAAAGARVAKHGNRAVSSKCGSADVLVEMGVNVDLDAEQMVRVLDRVGIAFLFAPRLHPAMAAVGPVRKALGIRTIFNILGPLTNPARAGRQVLGVFAPDLVEKLAQVLQNLGVVHALVVHGKDGLDEISTCDTTIVAEIRDGEIKMFDLEPEQFGVKRRCLDDLAGGDAKENADIARKVIGGAESPVTDIVNLNAGAALYVGGVASSIPEGLEMAREAVRSGKARETLEHLIVASQEEARA